MLILSVLGTSLKKKPMQSEKDEWFIPFPCVH